MPREPSPLAPSGRKAGNIGFSAAFYQNYSYDELLNEYISLQQSIQNEETILNGNYSWLEKTKSKLLLSDYYERYRAANELLIVKGNYCEQDKERAQQALQSLIYQEQREDIEEFLAMVAPGGKAMGAGKAALVNKIENLTNDMKSWLGNGARLIKNKSGDTVIISNDGTRRIRFDINNPAPHNSPHGHIEELVNGKWVKSGPIYPKDVPHN